MPETYNETTKVCLFGEYCTKKTLQVGSLIEAFGVDNVAIMSAEHGLGTIRSLLTNPAMVKEVDTLDDVRQAWAWANEHHNVRGRWLVLDGMTRVMQWMSNRLFAGAESAFDSIARGYTLKPDQIEFARYITKDNKIDTMAIYGRLGRDSENLLNSWLKLDCNIYATYLSDMTGSNDKREKCPPWGPDVPGKVGLRSVMSSFDFVLASVLERDGSPTAIVRANPLYLTRTREDRLHVEIPNSISNFNLAAFVNLITHKEG